VASYYELIFPTLKPGTQAMRRGILDRFCAEHGDKPVADIEHHHVTAILAAKSKTPHAANSLRKVLRHVFKHAVKLGWRKNNPVLETERIKTAAGGFQLTHASVTTQPCSFRGVDRPGKNKTFHALPGQFAALAAQRIPSSR
jgi:hypothetical protein